MFCPVILKNPLNLFQKRDAPEIGEKDEESKHAIRQIEKESVLREDGQDDTEPSRQKERKEKKEEDTEKKSHREGKAHGPRTRRLLLFGEGLIG